MGCREASSIVPDNCEESSCLNQMMNNSWKFRCQWQCFAKHHSRGDPAAELEKRKTKRDCTVDSDESLRPRLEGAVHKHHEDHITAKGMNSLNHDSLVHQFIPMPQAKKIPKVKAAVEKEW